MAPPSSQPALTSAAPPPAFRPGAVLGGRYELLRKLGEGGAGQVWLARNQRVGRLVAIKTLRPQWATSSSVLERFRVEALATNCAQHPNIVQVFDADKSAEGHLYLVMEYVRGQTLNQMLNVAGAFPLRTACHLIAQVASAIAAAHRSGVIHRDLKPANIMITGSAANPQVKVMDFGLAAQVLDAQDAAAAARLTAPEVRIGTPQYMAPEQGGRLAPSPRLDVYSLGVLLFEMLAGQLPFGDARSIQVLALKNAQPAPSLATMVMHELPPALVLLVDASLSIDPRCRPPDAGVFLAQLRAAVPDCVPPEPDAKAPSSAARASDQADAPFEGLEHLSLLDEVDELRLLERSKDNTAALPASELGLPAALRRGAEGVVLRPAHPESSSDGPPTLELDEASSAQAFDTYPGDEDKTQLYVAPRGGSRPASSRRKGPSASRALAPESTLTGNDLPSRRSHAPNKGRGLALAVLTGSMVIAASVVWAFGGPRGGPAAEEPAAPDARVGEHPSASTESPVTSPAAAPAAVTSPAAAPTAVTSPAAAPAAVTSPATHAAVAAGIERSATEVSNTSSDPIATPTSKAAAVTAPPPSAKSTASAVAKPSKRVDCKGVEERARQARRSHDWPTLLAQARKSSCFDSRMEQRKLLTKAYLELERFEACASAGAKLQHQDPEVKRWVTICRARAAK